MFSTYAHTGSSWRIVVETEQIEITSYSQRADKQWRFVDTAGHEHRYEDGYPTLRWVIELNWCHGCQDVHDFGFYECPVCLEHVTPGTTGPCPFREFIPGPTKARLELEDGQVLPLSDDDLGRIQAVGRRDGIEQEVAAILERWRSQISR